MSDAPAPSAFVGTEPPPAHLQIDAESLKAWVGGRLAGFDGPITIAKFKGGQSNPTYRISTNSGGYVLRRKPPGPLLPTAHAIDREFRVLSALVGSGVPIPHPHIYCNDESIIGSEFYIVDAVDGVIHWQAQLPDAAPEYRHEYYRDLLGCLAKIHTVDWKAAGLEGFGKSANYASRNLERWYRSYSETKAEEIPDMDWVVQALRERLPDREPVCLIHGDYGNHNIIVAPDTPHIKAVLDWEMSTIGNPLIDLAHSLRPWFAPPAPGNENASFVGKDLAALGVPSQEENIETYTEMTGIPWRDSEFYFAFVLFRTAAMVQGILHRHKTGSASNKTLAHSQGRVITLAKKARSLLSS